MEYTLIKHIYLSETSALPYAVDLVREHDILVQHHFKHLLKVIQTTAIV
jgi:hypothetical protein